MPEVVGMPLPKSGFHYELNGKTVKSDGWIMGTSNTSASVLINALVSISGAVLKLASSLTFARNLAFNPKPRTAPLIKPVFLAAAQS
jgi:hypothetical protein